MITFVTQQAFENSDAVAEEFPCAAEIIEVEGGWMVFDTVTEAETWLNQQ